MDITIAFLLMNGVMIFTVLPEMSRKEAILTAIDNGVRLYLVKYRKGKQQGNKKRIATKNMA